VGAELLKLRRDLALAGLSLDSVCTRPRINTAWLPTPSVAASGLRSITCSASDTAGNSVTGTGSHLVHHKLLGFYSPTGGASYKTGGAIPVEIALANADNTFTTTCTGCNVTVSALGGDRTERRAVPDEARRH
jgi:hypothetical protein